MISFLDTCISLPTKDDEAFSSKVFRKTTYTGLILNFSAMCPPKWKFGLIQCLLHRAYLITSTWKLFCEEVDFLKNIFNQNGYPDHLFFSCVKRFLNSKFKHNTDNKIIDEKVETMFFVPYIGLPSVIFGRKLRELIRKYYGIDVRIVFTTFKVKNYFSLKCRTPLPLLANIVYTYKCLRDANNVYIGKTMRHLATRVKEHGNSSSAISDHLKSCDTCKRDFSYNSFSILDRGKNDLEITIKEALHIKSKKPNLNKQLFSQGSSFVLNIF